MAKADPKYSTPEHTRRNAVVIMAGALAAAGCAIGLAAAASQPTACAVDPVIRKIEAHRQAVAFADYESARFTAAGGADFVSWRPASEAFLAEIDAAKVLIATVPSSMAGLQALEAHLRDARYHRATRWIERRVTCGDCVAVVSGGPEAIDWLISQHADALG
jgi:hypothetical protein